MDQDINPSIGVGRREKTVFNGIEPADLDRIRRNDITVARVVARFWWPLLLTNARMADKAVYAKKRRRPANATWVAVNRVAIGESL